MISSLLSTKLYMPSPGVGSSERSRLTALLNEGRVSGKKLTLISAPAGYGKTTTVSSWLHRVDCPVAGVSLDEADDDPVLFLAYLIAALKSVVDAAGETLDGIFHSPVLPPAEVLVTVLVNDITSAGHPFILVLDDYHVIHSSFIHEVVQRLIDYLPPLMHMVIVTREDPPLPLAKWRVRGMLTEIRAADLRFSLEETVVFLQKANLNLSSEEIKILQNRTEGWIAGLKLAAISLQWRRSNYTRSFIEEFNGSHRYVIDYLMEEVLRQLEPEVRDFLCRTAVLDRFCPSLCDAVTGRCDSKTMLAKLEQTNLFLIPQDDYRVWFRYHHLFADFLRTELAETERAELHKKAAVWYEGNGYIEYAVRHGLSTGDLNEARSMILRVACKVIENGQLRTLLGWIGALPGQMVFNNDELLSYKAFALFFTGQVDEAAKCVIRSKNISPGQISNESQGRFWTVEALLAMARDDQPTLKLAERALKLIDNSDPVLKMFTLITLGQIQRITGNLSSSTRTFRAALNLAQKAGSLHSLGASIDLALNLGIQGKLQEAIDICNKALRTGAGEQGKLFPWADLAYIPLGIFSYERNQLEMSWDYLLKGLEAVNKLGLSRITTRDSEIFMARVLYLKAEKESAFKLIKKALDQVDQSALPLIALRLRAQEADLKLKEGELEAAVQWAERAGLSPDDHVTFSREMVYFTFARILMARKQYNDAQSLLHNLEKFARQGERFGSLITVYILHALNRLAASGIKEAVPYAVQAVQLAAPEGYCSAFLYEGPEVIVLLHEVRYLAPLFVDDLLTAFNSRRFNEIKPGSDKSEGPHSIRPQARLIDPLSRREQEILRLITVGLTNGDIASKLNITVGTVKWHTTNIYSKLNVKTRTRATALARELGLLD